MIERDEIDALIEQAFGAKRELDPQSASRPLTPPGCLPVWRFRPNAVWADQESQHVAGCRSCQGKLAALWEVRCPGLGVLSGYHGDRRGFPYAAAMERHLTEFACPRCDMVLRILDAPARAAAFGPAVGRMFRWEDLGFTAAADAETLPAKLLLALPALGDLRVEVTIMVRGDELVIRGWVEKGDIEGKVLAIDFWDDLGSHPYRAVFHKEGDGFSASLRMQVQKEIAQGLRNGGVVVASVEEDE